MAKKWVALRPGMSAQYFTTMAILPRENCILTGGIAGPTRGILLRSPIRPGGDQTAAAIEDDQGAVYSVGVSPDAKTVAYGTWGRGRNGREFGAVFLRKAKSGRQVWHNLEHHKSNVSAVEFSHDGTLLATGSWDNTVAIWEAHTGRLQSILRGHRHSVWSLRFSKDDTHLYSASSDGTVRVWSVSTGKLARPPLEHKGPVYCIALSPVGSRLAAAGRRGEISLWNVDTGVRQVVLSGSNVITSMQFSRSGKRLVVGRTVTLRGAVECWNIASGKVAWVHKESDNVVATSLLPNTDSVVFLMRNGVVTLRDITTGVRRARFRAADSKRSSLEDK